MRLTLAFALLLGSCSIAAPCFAEKPAVSAPAMPCHAPSPKAPADACMAMPCCHEASLSAAPRAPLLLPRLLAVLTGEAVLPTSRDVVAVEVASPPGGLEALRVARRLGRPPPAVS